MTSASACRLAKSVGSSSTTSSPWYPASLISSLALARSRGPSSGLAPALLAIGPPQRIKAVAGVPVFSVAGDRRHVFRLIDGIEQRLAHLGVVERRLQLVEAQQSADAERAALDQGHVRIAIEQRVEIGRRIFPPIGLAGGERRQRRGLVGDIEPLDPVDVDDFAARGPARRLLARHVFRVLDKDDLVAGLPFAVDEFERAGAGRALDLLVGAGFGDAAAA